MVVADEVAAAVAAVTDIIPVQLKHIYINNLYIHIKVNCEAAFGRHITIDLLTH